MINPVVKNVFIDDIHMYKHIVILGLKIYIKIEWLWIYLFLKFMAVTGHFFCGTEILNSGLKEMDFSDSHYRIHLIKQLPYHREYKTSYIKICTKEIRPIFKVVKFSCR